MELTFEYTKQVGQGSSPDVLQFYDTSAQVFSLNGGVLYGKPTLPLDGNFKTPVFGEQINVSPDIGISNFSVDGLNGFGAVGSYLTGSTHKLLIYEYALEVERFLEQATVRQSTGSPITSFSMTLANPIDEGSDKGDNVAISERSSLISPGSKITLKFQLGDSEEYDIGQFYVDRSQFEVLRPEVQIDGRNLIGKALSEQTLDENTAYPYRTLTSHITKMLENANLAADQFFVESTGQQNSFSFDPTKTVLDAIKEILKVTINWKIDELPDGTIVVGSPGYSAFIQSGVYSFKRGSEIYSRSTTRDDMQSYRRVCVHNSDFTLKVYRNVQTYTGWNLRANKTLYVNVPDGTREADANLYADELAIRLENVGKVESFSGPFRPYLTVGDRAVIQSAEGNDDLGTITDITHTLGKRGYSTEFTVDSGGRIGKELLSEYIGVITKSRTNGSIGYDPPDE
jgi:hypothetical protein